MQPLAVLDLAGTTVAATEEVGNALADAFRAARLVLSTDAVQRVRGRSKRDAIAELLSAAAVGSPPATVDALHASFRHHLLARYARSPVRPIAGAEATMRWLVGRGLRVALTTGFDREVLDVVLAQVGWSAPLFDAIVCADDVSAGRPAPDMIHAAMQRTRVTDPARVVVVGDTVADLQAARAAGAGYAIGVLTGVSDVTTLQAEHPAAILGSVAELPTWWETHIAFP